MGISPCERGRGAAPEQGDAEPSRRLFAEERSGGGNKRRLGDPDLGRELRADRREKGLALTEQETKPFLQVVRGDATPEEVAALVAVIASMSGGTSQGQPKPRSTWAHPARGLRSVHRHGPGAWRASGLPR
jgi:hypothetical protein